MSTTAPSPASAAFPGYSLPAASYVVAPLRHTSRHRLPMILSAGLTVVIGAVLAVSLLVTPAKPRYVCPPDCGRPPIGTPVESNPRFTASNGEFSVEYPRPGTAYVATFNSNGVVLTFIGGDTGTLELFGEPAQDRTPPQIADELIRRKYPDATTAYEIPNALVGYQPGYGVVADDYPQDSAGSYIRLRLLVMVAVKNGLALIAAAVGPYHQFSPDFGSGHPSGANLELALEWASTSTASLGAAIHRVSPRVSRRTGRPSMLLQALRIRRVCRFVPDQSVSRSRRRPERWRGTPAGRDGPRPR
jgi:hypothetical protein